jgi:SAM-dependent methyltransferase
MSDQREINNRMWAAAGDDLVREYRSHPMRAVERAILDRHRAALSGRVLEVGVGGGRLTEELLGLGATLTGIDLSPAMVESCRRRFPAATFAVADLADLSGFGDDAFDAIVAGYNVLDVLGHEERLAALDGWHRVLAPGGLLVLSTHNLHAEGSIPDPGRILVRSPVHVARNLARRRLRLANHARLAQLERRGDGWAVLNDDAHEHSLLHYYATRDLVERQLGKHGFTLLECLDLEGATVPRGERAPEHGELHYCARSSPRP